MGTAQVLESSAVKGDFCFLPLDFPSGSPHPSYVRQPSPRRRKPGLAKVGEQAVAFPFDHSIETPAKKLCPVRKEASRRKEIHMLEHLRMLALVEEHILKRA